MKKHLTATILSVMLTAALCLTGCVQISDESLIDYKTFTPSAGLESGGYWQDVKALDSVVLCSYEGITIPADVSLVTDEAVQKGIEQLLESFKAPQQITDRDVKDGDTLNIDYVGSIDGVEFTGGNTNGLGTDVTIGVTNYIDDFLQQLIGHKPGETINVEVTFPENYHDSGLAGRDAVFVTTINYICGDDVYPELTDEFVTENLSGFGWKTADDMRIGISENLRENAVTDYICEYLLENSEIKSVPKIMTDYQKASLLNYYYSYAQSMSMSLEDFLPQYLGIKDADALVEKYREDYTRTAKINLLLQAAAEQNGISASAEDVDEFFLKYYGSANHEAYTAQYGDPYLRFNVLQDKVTAFIAEKAIYE